MKLSNALGSDFDSATVEPAQSFDLLPAGTYTVEIVDVEVKENSKKTGLVMKLQASVIDPEKHANRRLFKAINIQHTNAEAERIGRGELAALCNATGIRATGDTDTDEFIGEVVKVKVAIRPAKDQYEAQNEIKGFESALVAPTPKAPPSQVNAKAAPPWAK
jgi:hypothetical protein